MPEKDDLARLNGIAGRASPIAEWQPFAAYLDLRATGRRPAAMAAVRAFADAAKAWKLDRRIAFVQWLSDEAEALGDPRLLVPGDLLTGLVAPTIREWLSHQPDSAIANYLAGKYCQGQDSEPLPLESFRRAVALDPGFQPPRRAFVAWVIAHGENHQHELPWHGYLGEASEDVRDLTEARSLLEGIDRSSWRDAMGARLEALLEAARAWEDFSRTGEPDFAAWCREHAGPRRFAEDRL